MKETRYTAYLIRWQEESTPGQWRAFAENAYTGEKILFTSKRELVQFLWQSLNEEANSPVPVSENNVQE